MMAENNISAELTDSMQRTEDDENPNNDRELISEFLLHTKDSQHALAEMESNNLQMQQYVQELISDKKSSQNQKDLQDNIQGLMSEN